MTARWRWLGFAALVLFFGWFFYPPFQVWLYGDGWVWQRLWSAAKWGAGLAFLYSILWLFIFVLHRLFRGTFLTRNIVIFTASPKESDAESVDPKTTFAGGKHEEDKSKCVHCGSPLPTLPPIYLEYRCSVCGMTLRRSRNQSTSDRLERFENLSFWVIAIMLLVLATLGVYKVFTGDYGKKRYAESQLEDVIIEMAESVRNEMKLPKQVGRWEVYDVKAEGKSLVYKYRARGKSIKKVSRSEDLLRDQVCANTDMRFSLDLGITFVYRYYDSVGSVLGERSVSPDDCSQ